MLLIVLIICASFCRAWAADSEAFVAWAKAENAYTQKLQEAFKKGKTLSFEERKKMHDELFAESEKAQQQELQRIGQSVNRFSDGFFTGLIKKLVSSAKNPSQVKPDKEAASSSAALSEARADGVPEKFNEKSKAPTSSSAGEKPQPIAVAPGAAETVSYQGDSDRAPSTQSSANDGGAEEVHFDR
jgi:hypothetical protein